jgi:hypothetical protein
MSTGCRESCALNGGGLLFLLQDTARENFHILKNAVVVGLDFCTVALADER